MVRLHRLALLVASATMLLLLVACGQNATGSDVSQPGLTGTSGNAQLLKTGIVHTKVPAHSSPTPTAPVRLAGKVTLVIDATPQNVGASITVTLSNQSNQEILFPDHLTDCTVVLLQVQPAINSGTWQAVAPCKLQTPTRLLSLAQGKSLTVTLIPPGGQWSPGLYRALVSYGSSGAGRGLQTAFTQSFLIGS